MSMVMPTWCLPQGYKTGPGGIVPGGGRATGKDEAITFGNLHYLFSKSLFSSLYP